MILKLFFNKLCLVGKPAKFEIIQSCLVWARTRSWESCSRAAGSSTSTATSTSTRSSDLTASRLLTATTAISYKGYFNTQNFTAIGAQHCQGATEHRNVFNKNPAQNANLKISNQSVASSGGQDFSSPTASSIQGRTKSTLTKTLTPFQEESPAFLLPADQATENIGKDKFVSSENLSFLLLIWGGAPLCVHHVVKIMGRLNCPCDAKYV